MSCEVAALPFQAHANLVKKNHLFEIENAYLFVYLFSFLWLKNMYHTLFIVIILLEKKCTHTNMILTLKKIYSFKYAFLYLK